jgi:hypothetical protein
MTRKFSCGNISPQEMILFVICSTFPDPDSQGEAFMRKAVCAVLFLAFCPFLVAQQVPFLYAEQEKALNNDAIIKMVKAQLSDDVIVTTINASPGAYDTSPARLARFRRAFHSRCIRALCASSSGRRQRRRLLQRQRRQLAAASL